MNAQRILVLLVSALTSLTSCIPRRESSAAGSAEGLSARSPPKYPASFPMDHADDYHGTRVQDPHRWLEDLDAPATRNWIDDQNRFTADYLASIPQRAAIRARLERLWNFERYTPPIHRGGKYFFARNDGLQNQSVLYVLDDLAGAPRVLLDPNKLSADGTVALASFEASPGGRWIAYGTSGAGSDWQEWRVRDVATGKDLPDDLRWIKFSGVSFRADSSGFYYSRYAEPKAGEAYEGTNYFQKLYFHRLGTSQAEDSLVYERTIEKEKDWGMEGRVTDDGRYLIISIRQGTDTRNRIHFQDLAAGSPVRPLLDEFDASYEFLGNDGPVFLFSTDLEAPRGRIIAVDSRSRGSPECREVLSQVSETLLKATAVGGAFVVHYLKDAYSCVRIHDLRGKMVRELDLPGIGTATGFEGTMEHPETFFSFATFTTPPAVYRLDVPSGSVDIFRAPKFDFDSARYETRQVFYPSKDGVRIPMFITLRKGLALDGRRPTILYGYGGFNIPISPFFAVPHIAWLEMGGIYAVANIRGGGEYGEEWHQAGMRAKKQNGFDDFIAASEWLASEGYTSPAKLAIEGRSNGGLLVGACMTQRPDLFAAAVPGVGVLDMLRFHKFTIGWAWVSDYGSADNPEDFPTLYAYSPLHNVKPGTRYPATLVLTADHDDRVVPSHSYKFVAAVQAAQAGPRPILARIDVRAGHGAGKPTGKLIDEAADKLAFLVRELAVEGPPQPEGG